MIEITSINLTNEAFDKIHKNMDGGIFVSFSPEISKVNVLENDNPSTEELRERINSLYKRFQNFQTEEKNLGIEQIKFNTILVNQISALLNRDITDNKSISEAVNQAEATMLKLENEVAFIKAVENPTRPTKEQYQNHLKKVTSNLTPEMQNQLKEIISKLDPQTKKQIQQTVKEIMQKQIENIK
ncbi:hypothetical protein HDR60_03485 [bacterium]|nr:hypothetical protein [bacterium]